MVKWLAAALVALVATCAAPAYAWDLNELNKRADQNLYSLDGCSGTLVNVEHRVIITAYHCIDSAIQTKKEPILDQDGNPVTFGPDDKPMMREEKKLDLVHVFQKFLGENGEYDQVDFEAKIIARNKGKDVALLQIPQKIGPVTINIGEATNVPLAPKGYMAQRGSTTWHIGNPIGLYGTVTRGIISNTRSLKEYGIDFADNPYYIQYDGSIAPGSSGGAVYSDEGTYLGITTLMAGEPFLGFAVPMEDVWSVADKACVSNLIGGVNPASCPKPKVEEEK